MPASEISPEAFSDSRDGVILQLHVQPGASQSRICGMFGSSLKIALAAPPVDGKANKELFRFLCGKLGIAKSQITFLSGETSRDKRLLITGMQIAQIMEKLSI